MQIFENNSAFYGARAAIGRSGWNRIECWLEFTCTAVASVTLSLSLWKWEKHFHPLSRSPKLLRMTFPRDFLVFWRCRKEQRLCWCGAAPNFNAKNNMKWDLSMQQTVKNNFKNLWFRKTRFKQKTSTRNGAGARTVITGSRTPPTKTFSFHL